MQAADFAGATQGEFEHLGFHCFHNGVCDFVRKDDRWRFSGKPAAWDMTRSKYDKDTTPISISDATMSLHETFRPGAERLHRPAGAFPPFARIDPGRMFPLTLAGRQGAMRSPGQ